MILNGVDLLSSSIMLTNSAFYGIMISGIAVYSVVVVVFYFLAKRALNKGINVD